MSKLNQLKMENEELKLLVEHLERKLNVAEKNLSENLKILDQEWQQKLRFRKCHCIAAPFVSNRVGLVYLHFELEKLQTENNQRLADCMSSSSAAKESEINQCAAAAAKEESFRQSVLKKDAEIIKLMDEKDSLQSQLEEKEELHRQEVLRWEEERKVKEQHLDTLTEELFEAKCQLEKQVTLVCGAFENPFPYFDSVFPISCCYVLDIMADLKQGMEEECQRLQETPKGIDQESRNN
ncbi:hypothetical protein Avbf_10971 [Armadillidium vulgare]|nr:hypothetical protein Avbf_10971 [Armadillidium vulgare]